MKGNKILLGTLAAMTALIVILVIAIVAVNVSKNNPANPEPETVVTDDTKTEKTPEQLSQDLTDLMKRHDDEKFRETFNGAVEQAIAKEDYSRAKLLYETWMDELILMERCDLVATIIRDNKAEQLPPVDLRNYYMMVVGSLKTCNEAQLAQELTDKVTELENSGKVPRGDYVTIYDNSELTEEEIRLIEKARNEQ